MELILILGPMKSGKSFELISYFMPLKYTNIKFNLYQPIKNKRDEDVWSRNGVSIKASKIRSLKEVLDKKDKVIGIDEIHMFSDKEVEVIEELLKKGKKVIVSGLDLDYKGKMFPIIKRLFELAPRKVKYKRAVCELCKNPEAIYTQIFKNNKPVTRGLPSVVPEDGKFTYVPVCRDCFINNK
jgi:thymidine kinase